MLRRPRASIELPRRQDHRRYLSFCKQEQEAYDIAKKRAVECLEDAFSSGRPQDGYRNALEKINYLRVICELGCLQRRSTFLSPETNPFISSQILTPNASDRSLTPNSTTGEGEENCDLETSSLEGILLDVQQDFFSNEEFSLSETQWPTKIHALVQDIKTCTAPTKRQARRAGLAVVFGLRSSWLIKLNCRLEGISTRATVESGC
ncbi:hypothetical protein IL306_013520 [Fusarium sp. DS 682]|nr:hypothetical protein IL306_013520 [Fusarium sp. DS 682]